MIFSSTSIVIAVFRVGYFILLFHITSNYVPAWKQPCVNTYEWV